MGRKNRKSKSKKQSDFPLFFQPADSETSSLSNTLLKVWNEAHKANHSLQDVPFLFVIANIATQIQLYLQRKFNKTIPFNCSSLHTLFKSVKLSKKKQQQQQQQQQQQEHGRPTSGDSDDISTDFPPTVSMIGLNEQRSLIDTVIISLFADPLRQPSSVDRHRNVNDIDHHSDAVPPVLDILPEDGDDDNDTSKTHRKPTSSDFKQQKNATYAASSLTLSQLRKLVNQCHEISAANSYHLNILRDELVRNDINNGLIDLQFLWEEIMNKRLPDDDDTAGSKTATASQKKLHHQQSKGGQKKLSESQFKMLDQQYHSIEKQLTILRLEMNRLHNMLNGLTGETDNTQHTLERESNDDDCMMTDTDADVPVSSFDQHQQQPNDSQHDHDDAGHTDDAEATSTLDHDHAHEHEEQESIDVQQSDTTSVTSHDTMSDSDDDDTDTSTSDDGDATSIHSSSSSMVESDDEMALPMSDPIGLDKINSIAAEIDAVVERFEINTNQLDLTWFTQSNQHLIDIDHDSDADEDLRKAGLTQKIPLDDVIDREHTPMRWTPEQIIEWYGNLEKVHREYYYIGEIVMKKLFQVDSIETSCPHVRARRKSMVKQIYALLDAIDTKKSSMKQKQALLYPVFKYATAVIAEEKEKAAAVIAAVQAASKKDESQTQTPDQSKPQQQPGDTDDTIVPQPDESESDDDDQSSDEDSSSSDDDNDDSQLQPQELTKTTSQPQEQVNPKLLQYSLDFYRKLPKLSPKMEMLENKDAYIVRAVIPNLYYDSLALTVAPETPSVYGRRSQDTVLRLTGTVLPTASQEQQMITRIKQLFQQQQQQQYRQQSFFGMSQPQSRAVDPYYLQQSVYKLCTNKYGDIIREIQVPYDGDIATTTLTYDDSVLLITIPKKKAINPDIPVVRNLTQHPSQQTRRQAAPPQPQRQQPRSYYQQPRYSQGYNPFMSPFGF